MKQVYKILLENTASGNIKKDTAIEVIKMLKKVEEQNIKDIAIIGMSANYPMAEDLEQFWWNIKNSRNLITSFPSSRKNLTKEYLKFIGKDNDEVKFNKGSYLEGIDEFDYRFFNITPKEAELLDPNQRMFLENVYHTIEDAGYINDIKGSKTGVFLGFANELRDSYIDWLKECHTDELSLAAAGNLSSIIPARISFLKDLKGPSMIIDTACSSSLVAVHMACNAIRNGDCDKALVGGVRINLLPLDSNAKIGIESSDGNTRTFDYDADGTGSGEGVASIMLKPLKDAIRDKDNIYAVIKGSAVNQDGTSAGITAPNVDSQKKVLIEAWKNAGVNPESISYIEAHGTGTILGDPIEIEGITQAFETFTDKKQFCAIGAVKSNLGHLYEASGITGIIKTVLSLKNKQIPGMMNFYKPNSRIHFEDSPLYVNDKLKNWERAYETPRRCGVSAFGFSGTNCHIILEEAPEIEETNIESSGKEIFTLSAKSRISLMEFLKNYALFIAKDYKYSFQEICYGTNVQKEDFPYRAAIIAENKLDLYNKIKRLISKDLEVEEEREIFYNHHNIAYDGKKVLNEDDITLKEKNELDKKVINIIQQDNIDKYSLADTYVHGGDIRWNDYYGTKYNKITLPLYPFEKNSCWIKIDAEAKPRKKINKKVLHPLVEHLECESLNEDVYVTDFTVDKHFVLKDHVILGTNVIPGTTYIEMLKMIGNVYYSNENIKVQNLSFVKPISVSPGEVKRVQTIVNKGEDCLKVTVASKNEENEWDIHTTGEIRVLENNINEVFDIEDLKAEFNNEYIDIDQNELTKGFISFGPRWINYKKLYKNEGCALGELCLDDAFIKDLDLYDLHPSLMDMAVNIVSLVLGRRYLPLAYENIKIYKPLPQKFYSLVKFDKDDLEGETIRFDLKLLNENGEVLVDIDNYVLKRVREFNKIIKDNYFYSNVTWIEDKLNAQVLYEKTIVVFHDKDDIPERFIAKAKRNKVSVIQVILAEEFKKTGKNKYFMSSSIEDYCKLFEELKDRDMDLFVHMLNCNEYKMIIDNEVLLEEELEKGIYSLFNMSKALSSMNILNDMRICIVGINGTKTGDEILLNPHNSALYSMSKVMSKEMGIPVKAIDVNDKVNIKCLLDETMSLDETMLVSYRENTRYIELVEKMNIEEVPYSDFEISENNTYIITGGTGGIGMIVAQYLSKKNNVNIALINRSKFPQRDSWDSIINENKDSRKIKVINTIRQIESSGSKVKCYSCDISNYSNLSCVLDDIRKDFGGINGIFHAAGNSGNGFIINKDMQEFKKVVSPKIIGTMLINELTKEDNIDFLALFSSVASVMALPGQSDYTAANSYMDAFSYFRNDQNLKTLCINWPAWNESGMAVDNNADFDTLFKSIDNRSAIEHLNELLFKEVPRAIVGQWVYNKEFFELAKLNCSNEINNILQKSKNKISNKDSKNDFKVVLKGKDDNSYSDLEIKLGQIWGETLGFKEISIYDNFYELGGDSILAVRLINNINKKLKLKVNVTEVFNYLTINEFAQYIQGKNSNSEEKVITKSQGQKYYPITSEQRGIYLASQYEKESKLYNLPLVIEMVGQVNIDKLNEIFNKLVARHESLRTCFKLVNDEIVMAVEDIIDFKLEVINCRRDEIDETISSLVKPFDLENAPLIRASLVKSDDDRNFLFIDIHHIAADGYSMSLLLKDFMMLFSGIDVQDLSNQYSDFSMYEEKRKVEEDFLSQKKYWNDKFAVLPETLNLTTDFPRNGDKSHEGDYITFNFDEELSSAIKNLSNKNKTTSFVTLLSALNVLLYKYSNQEDIVIGSSISGRLNSSFENIVGMFMNMLPLRSYIDTEKTFTEMINDEKGQVLEAMRNQEYPFDDIINDLNIDRGSDRNPLFDVCFNFQNINKDFEITDVGSPKFEFNINNTIFKSYDLRKHSAKYDLMFEIVDNKQAFKGYLEYSTCLFKKETVERLAKHYINILKFIVNNPDVRIKDISIISQEERKILINEFNDNKFEFDHDKLIYMRIEENAAKNPQKTALQYEDETVTYDELNKKANKIGRYLISKCAYKEDLVALLIPRSPLMVEAILGIWKSGNAYIPMDVTYPFERINTIAEDSGLKYILTYSEYVSEELEEALGDKLIKIDLVESEIDSQEDSNLDFNISKDNLAYVIYTSGSTGKPKGAMVEQIGMTNHILAKINDVEIRENSVIVENASQCFDISVWQFFSALAAGGKTVIYNNATAMDPEKIINKVIEDKVTILEVVPSFLSVILDYLEEIKIEFKDLRYVLVTGETVKGNLVKRWFDICKDIKMINAYGPTEASDDITHFIMDKYPEECLTIPIGKTLQNFHIYILDKDDNLCPVGVKGEIAVSGIGVGRGYLNNEEKTKAAFLEDMFAEKSGVRMYRTGDLGRWMPDKNLEFFGRKDYQVKIRGFRIELGEIEAKLAQCEGVKECVVIDLEDDFGTKYLCAYVACDKNIETSKLKSELKLSLPEYMIPSFFVQLESLPLNANGKIDRKALPKPEANLQDENEYVEPVNEVEKNLADIWMEVLGAGRIGIRDNFFELGGDSIKAIRIVSKMQKFGYVIDLKDLFNNSTIEELEGVIRFEEENTIIQEPVTGYIDLLPVQKSFFENNFAKNSHYNQSVMVKKKELNFEYVKKCFEKLVEHHDALRMVYPSKEVQFNRGINEDNLFELKEFYIRDVKDYKSYMEEAVQKIQESMNLESGPLVKGAVFKTEDDDYLFIAIHHLVVDGVSWRILIEDLSSLYMALENNEEADLPSKTNSYKEYSEFLKEYSTNNLDKEKKYWKAIEDKEVKPIPMKNEVLRRQVENKNITISFSKEKSEDLLRNVSTAYNTEVNDILLTALGMSINEVINSKDILISLEGHGRENLGSRINVTRTVGWFTSEYPVLLNIEDPNNIGLNIKNTKENLRRIPNRGIGYGILRYLKKEDFKLKPQICFNYLGQFDEDIDNSIFELSDISWGDNVSRNNANSFALEINGVIQKKSLNMIFTFNENDIDEELVERIAQSYKANLNNIIYHCKNKHITEETPSDYDDLALSIEDFEFIKNKYENDEIKVKAIYPLVPAQEGMLFDYLMDKEAHTNLNQFAFDIKGNLDIDLLNKAFKKLIDKHDILRTVFVYESIKDYRQVVLSHKDGDLNFEDLSDMSSEGAEEYIKEAMIKDTENVFDLSCDILIRLNVFKLKDNKYYLSWSYHHIIMDGWSIPLITNDLLNFYIAMKNGKNISIKSEGSYKEFVKYLENQDEESAKEYWTSYLDKYEGETNICEKLDADKEHYKVSEHVFTIDSGLVKALDSVSQKNKLTLNNLMEAVWGVLLQKYNNLDDVIFGRIVSGRNAKVRGIEGIAGLFINTIPVRVRSSEEMSIIDIAEKIKNDAVESNKFDYYPLAEIQNCSSKRRDLIDNIIVFQNYYIEDTRAELLENNNIDISFNNAREQTEYNISVEIELYEKMNIRLRYNQNLYDEEIIINLGSHIENILKSIAEDPSRKVKDIAIVSEEEKAVLIDEFNDNAFEFDHDKLIYMRIEENAANNPEKIALQYEDESVTYKELNERANKISRYLINKGIDRENLIALLLPRSPLMVEIILGIWKAGAAYIPMDVTYPFERINTIAQDSGLKYILTYSEYVSEELEEALGGKLIKLDLVESEIDSQEDSNLDFNISKDNLAYVIYTSGSTGKPKGAMVEQIGMTNHILAKINDVEMDENSIMVENASQCFDISVWQFFSALVSGGKTVIYSNDIARDPNKIINSVIRDKVTILEVVPSFLSVILDYLEENRIEFEDLRYVLVTGETVKGNLVKRWFNVCPDIKMINAYGPTEASDDITHFIMDKYPGRLNIPIGSTVQNFNIYILDKDENLCPVGVKGEIAVSGIGVGRGYLNNEEKTKAAFCEDMFAKEDGIRMYKTGDLGRWLPDKTIEFFGRKDYQVKIRGFRIELGEIEAKLAECDGIKECAVIDLEDDFSTKYLCAYVVSENPIEINNIKAQLKLSLPDYMVPSFFVQLEDMPLNANGKIDRKALPKPEVNFEEGNEYVEPVNEIQKNIAEIWQEVLGIPRVGIRENFFELGGDSIKAIRIVSKMQKFGYGIELKDIFTNSTIEELEGCIKTGIQNNINQEPVEGAFDLIPVQHSFFESNFTESNHYNQSVLLKKKDKLNFESVEKAFEKLVEHHDALRMIYVEEGKQFNRSLSAENLFKLKKIDIGNIVNYENYITEECNKIQSSMSLENGPLVKGAVFKALDGDYLFIAIHHLVVDGVSWRILIEDFSNAYMQSENNQDISLPLKTNSYKEYSEFLKEYSSSLELMKEKSYWKSVEDREVYKLPVKSEKTSIAINNKILTISFSKEETEDLLRNVNRAYNTEVNDILLTALASSIKNENILVNLEGHGRDDFGGNINVTRTVGWFTSEYPVVLRYEEAKDIGANIKNIKEDLRRIPNKGIGYGILKYVSEDKLESKIKPEICFNYMGQFDEEIDNSIFEVSHISCGDNVSRNCENSFVLEIEGGIENKILNMMFIFNEDDIDEAYVENIAQEYKNSLIEIIEHCKNKKETEYTASDLAAASVYEDVIEPLSQKEEEEYKGLYPVSRSQRRFLIVNEIDKDDLTYNSPMLLNINGNIDVDRLENAINKIIKKHEILRTTFEFNDGNPVQKVEEEYRLKINVIECESKEEDIINDLIKPFDLRALPLLRVNIIKVKDSKNILMIDMHHIISDGVSIEIFIRELIKAYNQIPLEPLKVQYKDFSVWQNNYLNSHYINVLEDYWMDTLENFSYTSFPEKVLQDEFKGSSKEFYFSREESDSIKKYCIENSITKFTFFAAVLNIILKKELNKDDITVGVPVAGRNNESLQNLIGAFLNVILLRNGVYGDSNINDYVRAVNINLMEALEHQDYPYEELYEKMNEKYDFNNADLYSIMLNYLPYGGEVIKEINLGDVSLTPYEDQRVIAKSDIGFYIYENKEDLRIEIIYKSEMFKEEVIQRMMSAFKEISNVILNAGDMLIKEIEYGIDEELEEIDEDMFEDNDDFFN